MKKTIMIVLTILLVIGGIGISSHYANAATIKHSGKSGDLNWKIDSDGVLTISGSGDYDGTEYSLNGMSSAKWCEYHEEIKKAVVNVNNITAADLMFYECGNLQSIDLSGFDTSKLTNIWGLFLGCSSLSSIDLSGFDTSNMDQMGCLFYRCSNLHSIDLSGFDTSKVTDMSWMFGECSSLQSINLFGFDTAKVTTMHCMFYGCLSLQSIDLSMFDMSEVNDMEMMFCYCSSLSTELHLSNTVQNYSDCFFDAATEDGSKILVSYSDSCSRENAEAIVNTKLSNSHVYLKEAEKVDGLSISNNASGLKVSWNDQILADGYEVYRKSATDASFSKVKTLKASYFTDENVKQGTQYSYKVRSYCEINGKKRYGVFSDVKVLYRVESTKLTSVTNLKEGVRVMWEKKNDVEGYCIYKKVGTGSFKKVITVESASTNSWTDQDVKHGKKYTYAVKPYVAKSLGKRSAGMVNYYLKAAVLDRVSSTKVSLFSITWEKRGSIDGYQVYYSTHSDFSSGTKTVKLNQDTLGVVISKLKSGKTYYVKERTYKTVNDKTYYSAWSTVKSVKVK